MRCLTSRMVFYIFVICSLFLLTDCTKVSRRTAPTTNCQEDTLPAISNMIKDYHYYYGKHWGMEQLNDSLLITICFYQRNGEIYVALSGRPFNLRFYYAKTGGIRSDMLGYCELDGDGLGVFDSVDDEKHCLVEHFIQGLTFESAQDLFCYQAQTDTGISYDYYDFICCFRIFDNYNYCLADSGKYYQLEYDDFEKDL